MTLSSVLRGTSTSGTNGNCLSLGLKPNWSKFMIGWCLQIDRSQDISSVRCSNLPFICSQRVSLVPVIPVKKAYAIVLMNRVKNEKSELEVKNNKTRNGKTYAIVWSHVVRLTIYLYNLWYQDELLEVMSWNLCTNIGFESDLFYSKVN